MRRLDVFSPAKINLGLRVLRRRPDGYHGIDSIVVPLSFGDTVRLRERRSGFSLSCSDSRLPVDRRNLALRAAQLFFERTGLRGGVSIRIEKRIPVAAGLGGGSSNAAAVLLGLRRLTRSRVSVRTLARWGLDLGADVPFFVHRRAARVEGIGERIRPLRRAPNYWYLLVNPGFPVSTRWVYRRLDLRLTKKISKNIMRRVQYPPKPSNLLRNDLERVVRERHPLVDDLKRLLLEAGALGAAMSGSGPTVFGVFESEAAAKEGLARIKTVKRKCPKKWLVVLARGLSRGSPRLG
ncbi:MAG: 4-(cytidine 5'-diphospho)-2-C-methyl-D-erythritol kinase, partial [Vicinamibacteria bacterium]